MSESKYPNTNPQAATDEDSSRNEIEQAQQELVDEMAFLGDWMARYQYIIDLGRQLPPYPPEYRQEQHRIRGCQSQVWVIAQPRNGRLHFQAVSDSAIVSGLIALLMRVYSGRRPRDILDSKPTFVGALELERHLSPTRSNGLRAMLERVYALAADMVADA